MEPRIRDRIVFATLVVFVVGLLPASAANLVHHYDLTSATPLTDLVGGNTLLSDGGTPVVGDGYHFGPGNEGLRLVLPNIDPDEYAIELTFSVGAVPLSGFHKIVDFDEGQNDAGFYVSTGGTPSFVEIFPGVFNGAPGTFQNGVPATVVITRAAAGEVKVFVDADEQITFNDSLLQVAVLGVFGTTDTLTFFEDDFGGSETGSGVVSEIKIYDAPFDPSIPPTATPPTTSDVTPNPNPASVNEMVVVTATIEDTGTDASNITLAEYEVREAGTTTVVLSKSSAGCPGPYLPCAADGTLDSTLEGVQFEIPAGSLTPGVYDVCVRGTDSDPSVGDFDCAFLAVYDPNGGFVTGGGWIQSDPSFCTLASCAGAAGKAQFGFVSKYKKGANVPTGETQFKFKAGDFDFDSTEYDWLVVAGPMGQFKGSGTINGSGDFAFMLTATDSAANGGPSEDEFRIKIWDKGTDTTVYDNGPNQPLGGGSIVIHK